MSLGRHPKKPIADALKAVAREGLEVVEIHRGAAMNTYEFTFVVDHRLNEDEVDGLFDRADDVTPEREQARTLLGFDRQATSLAEALVSALRDVEAAGLIVGSVRSEDLVTLKEIAARTRRSYESVRLLAAGKRGPGGFPGPMSSAGWTLYSWAQVRPWFAHHAPASSIDQDPLTLEHDRLIAAADYLVRARALMRGDHLADGLAALVSA